MAKFVIKIGKEEKTRDTDKVTIGCRSSCGLQLSDPLAAQEHCDVVATGGGFLLVDRGSTLRTWLDGCAVTEPRPLKDGSTIIVGVSRVNVKIAAEGGPAITLTLDKKYFYYDDKKDALDWSKKEVEFGTFNLLRSANWIAVLSVLVLLPFWFIPSTSDALLEPGPTWHSGIPAYHEQLAKLDASDQDCSACHDSFSGASNAKCLACHAEDVQKTQQHPIYAGADKWEMDCARCHVDHRGTHAEKGPYVHLNVEAPQSCGFCHEADKAVTQRKQAEGEKIAMPAFAFDSFSHTDHKGKKIDGRDLACADCHKAYSGDAPVDARPVEGERPREFQVLDYEACLACHGDAKAPDRYLKPAWHGARELAADGQSHCKACHAKDLAKDLRQAPAWQSANEYTLVSRSHLDMGQVSGPNGADRCDSCHKNGEELAGGLAERTGAFAHGTHILSRVKPADAAALDKACGRIDATTLTRGSCVSCHAATARSTSLAEAPSALCRDEDCTSCHKDALPRAKVSRSAAAATRNDFPHDRHLTVEGSCYACHDFDPAQPIALLPVTDPKVKDCTRCHDDHAHVGRNEATKTGKYADGTCQKCHKTIGDLADGVYEAAEEKGLDRRPLARSWSRPAPDRNFSHWSPGHVKDAGAKDKEIRDCAECHADGTWDAATRSGVPIPSETDLGCRRCHIEQKARFHWR